MQLPKPNTKPNLCPSRHGMASGSPTEFCVWEDQLLARCAQCHLRWRCPEELWDGEAGQPTEASACSLWSIKTPIPDSFFLLCHHSFPPSFLSFKNTSYSAPGHTQIFLPPNKKHLMFFVNERIVYSFLIPVLPNYQKFSSLEQYKFILL